MVAPILIGALIFAIGGIVLILIATAISGIISTKKEPGDTQNQLRASAGVSGFAALIAIIAAILGLLYGGASMAASVDPFGVTKGKVKGLFITFIITVVVVIALFVTVIGLNLTLRSNPALDPDQMRSMTAGIILVAIGILCIAISAIIIFIFARSRVPKGFGKAKETVKVFKEVTAQ